MEENILETKKEKKGLAAYFTAQAIACADEGIIAYQLKSDEPRQEVIDLLKRCPEDTQRIIFVLQASDNVEVLDALEGYTSQYINLVDDSVGGIDISDDWLFLVISRSGKPHHYHHDLFPKIHFRSVRFLREADCLKLSIEGSKEEVQPAKAG